MNPIPTGSGRNQRCSVCGEKVKKCLGHGTKPKRRSYLALVVTMLILALVVLTSVVTKKSDTHQLSPTAKTIATLEKGYIDSKVGNEAFWWLVDAPSVKAEAAKLAIEKKKLVMAVIEQYRDVSEFTQRIAEHFRESVVSLYLGKDSSMTVAEGGVESVKGKPEICFVSKKGVEETTSTVPFSLYWRSDWGLMMPAEYYPPKVFPGLLFHELGHGLIHPVSPTTIQFAFFSPEYIKEEVEMHLLEGAVMDRASAGRYFKEADSLIARYPNIKTLDNFLPYIHLTDLEQLDDALEARRINGKNAGMLFVQHMMTIGFRFAVARGLSEREIGENLYKQIHEGAY